MRSASWTTRRRSKRVTSYGCRRRTRCTTAPIRPTSRPNITRRRVRPALAGATTPPQPARPVAHPPPRDEQQLLGEDEPAHLRVAAHPIGEHDRDLGDATAPRVHAVLGLDLEAVALAARGGVVDRLQGVGAICAVPR